MAMKIIGRIENIPDYTSWSQFSIPAENFENITKQRDDGRGITSTARKAGRQRIADFVANKYGYEGTDVIGIDPKDHKKWFITDYSVVGKISNKIGLNKPVARIQVSEPGHAVPLHIDHLRFAYINDSTCLSEHGYIPNLTSEEKQAFEVDQQAAQRVIIFLEDWKYGQGFVWEDRIFDRWKSGDILYWDWPTDIHATFNCGYWSRAIVKITGMTTNVFSNLTQSENFTVWDFNDL